MRRVYASPEYRFIIPGKAVSFRSPKSEAYKNTVRNVANRIFSKPLVGNAIEVRLDYFHSSRRRMDMDNIAKCVLDALNGVAYIDDQQVRRLMSSAYSLASIVYIANGIVDLIKPLMQYEEYLFIRIREARVD